MAFDPAHLLTLRPLLDAIVPPDEDPGGWDAGCCQYLERLLAERPADAALVKGGLDGLELEARAHGDRSFHELSAAEREALLVEVESGQVRATWQVEPRAFFTRMVQLTNEGFYSDPGNGGNRGAASWKMIGYEPKVPPR